MSKRVLRSAASAGALLLALMPARAAAEGRPTARLRYEVRAEPGACPDEPSFHTLVVARLGRDPFVAMADDEVSVAIDRNRTATQARLSVTRGGRAASTRTFTESPEGCEALAEAVATATALTLDPVTPPLPPLPPAALPAPAAPPPPSSPPREPPPPPAPRPASGPPVRLTARAGVVTATGLAPGATGGLDLGVGLERGPLALFVEGRTETQLGDARGERGERIEATLLGGALAPCGHLGVFMPCLVARLGVLQGRAPDVVTPSLGSSTLASLGPRVGVWAPLGKLLALHVAAEAFLPLVRTTLLVDERPSWTAPAIAGGLSLSLGLMTDLSR